MRRTLAIVFAAPALCALGLISAVGQEAKPAAKATVAGGVAGHVKSVDAEKKTLTIVTADGAEKTYSIADDTVMVGPRGGKVPRRLRDPRFRQEGIGLTIVADGTKAKEIHLGSRRRAPAKAKSKSKTTDEGAAPSTKTTSPAGEPGKSNAVSGKVKSYDAQRHILVVALSDGRTRSFILSRESKVLIKGKTSPSGANDPAIKADAAVDVVVHPGTVRKVDEVRIDHPAETARPKAKTKGAA